MSHNAGDIFQILQTSFKQGLQDKIGEDALPHQVVAALLQYADAKFAESEADRAVTAAVGAQEGIGAAISDREISEQTANQAFGEVLETSATLAGVQGITQAEFTAAAEKAKSDINRVLGLRVRTGMRIAG
jgi:hypothetical protein